MERITAKVKTKKLDFDRMARMFAKQYKNKQAWKRYPKFKKSLDK